MVNEKYAVKDKLRVTGCTNFVIFQWALSVYWWVFFQAARFWLWTSCHQTIKHLQ